jgi:hypothetical protein
MEGECRWNARTGIWNAGWGRRFWGDTVEGEIDVVARIEGSAGSRVGPDRWRGSSDCHLKIQWSKDGRSCIPQEPPPPNQAPWGRGRSAVCGVVAKPNVVVTKEASGLMGAR